MAETIGSYETSISTISREIANKFIAEMRRAEEYAEEPKQSIDYEAVDLGDYVQACKEFLNTDNPFSENKLPELISFFRDHSRFKSIFRPNGRCLITVIPFSRFGNPLSAEEVYDGMHIKILTLELDGKKVDGSKKFRTVRGFTVNQSYIHELLPEQLQDCCFDIEDYDDDNDEQRLKILEKFKDAYKKLITAFKEA